MPVARVVNRPIVNVAVSLTSCSGHRWPAKLELCARECQAHARFRDVSHLHKTHACSIGLDATSQVCTWPLSATLQPQLCLQLV